MRIVPYKNRSCLLLNKLRLKKINAMSQSSWQIGRPDLNAFFLNFFFFPEQQTCQIWVGHSFEIWNLILDEQKYKTEHRVEEVCCSKCFIVSVISFLVYFDKQIHKKLEKNKQAKKFKPWILLNQTCTEKQMRTTALRHRIYFFSLTAQKKKKKKKRFVT